MPELLSKTKYLNGCQCLRYLWVLFNDSDRVPPPDASTQYVFDQGHVVGDLAKQLHPEGIDVPQEGFMANIEDTNRLLAERKPLFEAGILAGNLYSRVDVLFPVGGEEWDIVEVKSSTSVKEVYIEDAAYQRHCCEQSGLKIRKCHIAVINNKYVRDGDIDPKELFVTNDITDEVNAVSDSIPARVEEMFAVINSKVCPDIAIGPHCNDPYGCPLADSECFAHLPEGNVFTLYFSGKKSFGLHDLGVLSIKNIPEDYKLSAKQLIQKTSLITGEAHLDPGAIKTFLESLEYPLYCMDFETINPAVPLFDGTRPYQQTAFQFSVHVVREASASPEHYSFLAAGPQDPRPDFLAELKKAVGDSGSVLAYNKGFEEKILKDLGAAFPEYQDWITQLLGRMVDLIVPFRNFDYYHPDQHGSASLKAVLPALTGKGYDGLDIAEGQLASNLFEKVTYYEATDAELEKVRSDLEKYCLLDTEGMVWIVEKLRALSN
jgi:hypothetical protein